MSTITLDFETTTKNKGHPFTPGNFPVSYSLKTNNEPTVFKYYTDPDFKTFLREAIRKCSLLVGFAFKFDWHWLHNLGITPPKDCSVYDVQLAEFIISGQEVSYQSLNDVAESYGRGSKDDRVKEYWELGIDTVEIPRQVLQEYNDRDVDLTYELFIIQTEITNEKQHKLILAEGDDLKSLAEAERNGIKFNVPEAEKSIKEYQNKIAEYDLFLNTFVPTEVRQYFNWESGDDLSCLIYGGTKTFDYRTEEPAVYKSGDKKGQEYMKGTWHTITQIFPQHFKPLDGTEVKKTRDNPNAPVRFYSVDDPTLRQLKTREKLSRQLVDTLLQRAKDVKVMEMLQQFLNAITKYSWQEQLIHGQFNQNVARTGRLSSSNPNMQNTPPELDKFLISRYD